MFYIKIAIFPGKFDPINNADLDVIKKATKIFDKLIILVFDNKSKKCFFDLENRLRFIRSCCVNFNNVEIDYWPKLLSEYIELSRATVLIKKIENDFNFSKELCCSIINETFNNTIQTIFMLPNAKNAYINDDLVQGLCSLKKNLSSVVPKVIEQEIKKEV